MDKNVIWSKGSYELARKYKINELHHAGDICVIWRISYSDPQNEQDASQLFIYGSISKEQVDLSHSVAIVSANLALEGKSFSFSNYFSDWGGLYSNRSNIAWDTKRRLFIQEIDDYVSIQKFPLRGAKALFKDMDTILEELNWLRS